MTRVLAAAFVVSLVTATGALASTSHALAANSIATYRVRIPELMAEQGIPGLAVPLVDRERTLLVEGFGHLDDAGSAPVDVDTIFSAESMSKLFTATAVTHAVAAGRLDLDATEREYVNQRRARETIEGRRS